jgi:ribosome-associated toxin RatA of RatAB toxin-antitoxin module
VPIVESSISIDAPREEIFALAQDYYLRLKWDPFLREMRFLDGASEAAIGVHVAVRARNGLTMEVRYITLDEPETVAVAMTKGPFFFESFAGSWRFKAIEAGRTEVIFRYGFTTRWRALRPLFDPIIRRVFTRDIRKRLEGLKRAIDRGMRVGAG